MQNYSVKAGEVIAFSKGRYSDYGVCCYVVFRKDCDIEQLAKEWGREQRDNGAKNEWYFPSGEEFFAWLVINEYAVDFTIREIHIGDYGLQIGRVKIGYDPDEWEGLDDETDN